VNLTEANSLSKKNIKIKGKMVWKHSYSFLDEYKVRDLSPNSFFELWKKLQKDNTYWEKYLLHFHSRYPTSKCDSNCRKNRLCKMINVDYDDQFENCLKGVFP
jgi:hypothetical protein